MSSVAAAPPPVNAVPATNGVTSEAPAATTNNAGAAGDATTTSDPVGQNNTATPEETGHKVFAGNLAYATTNEGLKTFFDAFANDIVSTEVIQRGARPAGYGFVTFTTLESAEKAVTDLNDKELDGRPVIVQLAKPNAEKEKDRSERRAKRRATGRRNTRAPPGEVTEAEAEGTAEDTKPGVIAKAENIVEGAADAVANAVKPKKKKSSRKSKAAKKAAAAEGTAEGTAAGEPTAEATADGTAEAPKRAKKPRTPRAPRPPRAAGEQPEGQPSKSVLFVANLAFSIDDARLKQIFTDAGINVVTARVVTHRWGGHRSKGFGFVDVGSEEEQKKALDYFAPVESADGTPATGREVEGRQIAVKVAVDAPKREPGESDVDAGANSAQKSDATPETTVVAH